jgi:ribosomal protein L11 methyltransferase
MAWLSTLSVTLPNPKFYPTMTYFEYAYLLPEHLEWEVQENMAANDFRDFFIESFVGQDSVLKVFIANAPLVSQEVLGQIETLGLELLTKKEVVEMDWLKAWMDTLQPFELAEGVWVNPFPDRGFEGPNGALVLKVVPGTAFGTGLHSTTRLAAQILDKLELKDKSIVDVGSGTGILALLARFRGAQDLLCLDDDPVAAEKAHITFKDNHLGSIDSRVSDLLDAVDAGQQFDIVVANIIAEVLEMLLDHPRLREVCKPHTQLVFSGVSHQKLPLMQAAFARHHVNVLNHCSEGDWNGFLLTL